MSNGSDDDEIDRKESPFLNIQFRQAHTQPMEQFNLNEAWEREQVLNPEELDDTKYMFTERFCTKKSYKRVKAMENDFLVRQGIDVDYFPVAGDGYCHYYVLTLIHDMIYDRPKKIKFTYRHLVSFMLNLHNYAVTTLGMDFFKVTEMEDNDYNLDLFSEEQNKKYVFELLNAWSNTVRTAADYQGIFNAWKIPTEEEINERMPPCHLLNFIFCDKYEISLVMYYVIGGDSGTSTIVYSPNRKYTLEKGMKKKEFKKYPFQIVFYPSVQYGTEDTSKSSEEKTENREPDHFALLIPTQELPKKNTERDNSNDSSMINIAEESNNQQQNKAAVDNLKQQEENKKVVEKTEIVLSCITMDDSTLSLDKIY